VCELLNLVREAEARFLFTSLNPKWSW
jgi:hypothetical protein